MKVDDRSRLLPDRYRSQVTGVRPQGGQGAEPTKRSQSQIEVAAQVEISVAGRELSGSVGVRAEVVERLKAEVDAGTYNPDPREVAKKMIHGHR